MVCGIRVFGDLRPDARKPAPQFGTIGRFSIPKIAACPGPFSAS